MVAYYNEIDPYAAQWLRNLITAGHIAPGVVDERSIEDVAPSELAAFTQCHFFAGVGVWSAAARAAGWPDDRPLWTGSCPCQPFSTAGKGVGFADERHLWPAFEWLIQERKPAVVFGEQVASKDVDPWIDLVCTDLEGLGYAFGAVPFPSSGVGAPHIRDRCYWVADADHTGLEGRQLLPERGDKRPSRPFSVVGGLADSIGERRAPVFGQGGFGIRDGHEDQQTQFGFGLSEQVSERPGPVNGFWRDADWLGCTDDKWRAVEPGTFPLAAGVANRMGQVRAYGNAINLEAARVFIECYLDMKR